jgi:hypothetical protein
MKESKNVKRFFILGTILSCIVGLLFFIEGTLTETKIQEENVDYSHEQGETFLMKVAFGTANASCGGNVNWAFKYGVPLDYAGFDEAVDDGNGARLIYLYCEKKDLHAATACYKGKCKSIEVTKKYMEDINNRELKEYNRYVYYTE